MAACSMGGIMTGRRAAWQTNSATVTRRRGLFCAQIIRERGACHAGRITLE
jgi:hypothetical protein